MCLLLVPCRAHAGEDTIVLASLEWPPYTGEQLPGQGATTEVVRAAFAAMGYDVEVRFYPWKRVLSVAMQEPGIVGYFPEYPSRERKRHFYFTDSVGKSPLGFAKRRSSGISWGEYEDLKQYRIGTVRGYVNTDTFDAMVRKGDIWTDRSVSDLFNLRKVLAGRVDLAVADLNVYEYLLFSDGFLRSRRGELRFDPQLMDIHNLHVCFRKGKEGKRLLRLFNMGLSRITPLSIQREYIELLRTDRERGVN